MSDVEYRRNRAGKRGVGPAGQFPPGVDEEEFCDRRILARIHRATVGRLRREIEPVSQASFMRFLFRWQYAADRLANLRRGRTAGRHRQAPGVRDRRRRVGTGVAGAPRSDYGPELLDRLCTGGEVVWGRLSRRQQRRIRHGTLPRAAPLTRTSGITMALRESLDWLLDPAPESADNLTGAGAEILEILSTRGACFQAT